jgi:multidrug efflux pump subunit AcrA (membrane-fusion protein)
MADEGDQMQMEHQSSAGKWVLTGLAGLVVAVFGFAHYMTYLSVQSLTRDVGASQTQVKELLNRMQTAESQNDALREKVGLTKQELAQRVAELKAQQKASESRLEKEQKAQISAVTGEISGVKTDVGGVKSDVASTKADLEATKAKLQSTIGDLGVQSGLIAHTAGDLDILKHKGDRNYYEFTLLRGAKPQPVSTVSLQLKKADAKKGKFTMNVTSDDKTIEKKDRNVSEPIQFYSGREHMLFELVVWTVDKNKATGYLSTPKGAPVPVTAN